MRWIALGSGAALLLVTGVFFLLRPRTPQPPESPQSLDEVEQYLETLVDYGTPPGISVVVVKQGEVVYSEGFGLADGPTAIPASPETVYHWYSMTKIATAIAIFQLQEQGLLTLDDPVTDHLDFFDVIYPSEGSQPVTVRHLLNHSSGLPDAVPAIIGWIHHADEPPLNQTALIREKLPDYAALRFEPGTQTAYSNVGYMLLGAIIEARSGQSYEDYIRDHILQPLAMTHTDFIHSEAMLAEAAVGSHPTLDIQALLLPFLLPDYRDYVRERGEGRMWFNRFYNDQTPPTGLIGPAPEAARLLLAYLNGGELDGERILSAESVAAMTTASHIAGSDAGLLQGLGWVVSEQGGRLALGHDGGGPGFGAAMRLYPEEGLGIVIMSNDTTIDRKAILDLFARLEW